MKFRLTESVDADSHNKAPDSSMLRAFALLELIANAETAPSLEDLTRASGLPKPTVHRILGLLARGGLVQRGAFEKRYVVGPRVSALSLAVQMRSPARSERRAILSRLVEQIGETCNFTMLDGREVIYLDRVETTANVRLHMKPGSRVPLHCTASGKLFLAQLAPAQVRKLLGLGPLKRYTERTTTDIETLERELRRIRTSGIGTDIGEYLEGSVCLAVPVTGPQGRVCAAIAVHGPAPRMTLKRGFEFVPALKRAATAIAATMVGANAAPGSDSQATAAAPKGGVRVKTRHHHRGDHRRRAEEEGQLGGSGHPG